MNINIFIENIYKNEQLNNIGLNFEIDEESIYKNVKKISDYLLTNKQIYNNSCLNNFTFETVTFDIVLCNNEEIHRINKEYRKKDSATDVITFALFADSSDDEKFVFDGEIQLGEIIVSLEKIQEQADENNITFEDELYYIIAHGILHLLGYDHMTQEDYNFMVEMQNEAKAIVI